MSSRCSVKCTLKMLRAACHTNSKAQFLFVCLWRRWLVLLGAASVLVFYEFELRGEGGSFIRSLILVSLSLGVLHAGIMTIFGNIRLGRYFDRVKTKRRLAGAIHGSNAARRKGIALGGGK